MNKIKMFECSAWIYIEEVDDLFFLGKNLFDLIFDSVELIFDSGFIPRTADEIIKQNHNFIKNYVLKDGNLSIHHFTSNNNTFIKLITANEDAYNKFVTGFHKAKFNIINLDYRMITGGEIEECK